MIREEKRLPLPTLKLGFFGLSVGSLLAVRTCCRYTEDNKNKQDRQYTYDVILRRFRETFVVSAICRWGRNVRYALDKTLSGSNNCLDSAEEKITSDPIRDQTLVIVVFYKYSSNGFV
jgi:hypothetical protein